MDKTTNSGAADGSHSLPRAKNILFLVPQPFYRLRGACLAEKMCIEALSSSGFIVTVLCFPFGSDIALPGLSISRLWRIPFTRDVPIGPSLVKLFYDIELFLYLAVHLPFARYEVVHACEEAAVVAAFFRMFFDFRLVYDMDDILSLRLAKSGCVRSGGLLSVVRLAERFTLAMADAVLTNSADTTAFAASLCPEKVVFYDHIPPIPSAKAASDRGEGEPVIVYAGNLEPYQGIDLLLEALPAVFSACNANCLIIGGESGQIAAYQAKAEALGLGGRVKWAGKLDIEETFSELLAAAILVSPMLEDKAVPSKIYMYMAAGRPIVATANANYISLLKNGSGLIVRPSAEALAAGILCVLADKQLGNNLASGARSLFFSILVSTDIAAVLDRVYSPSSL